MSDMNSTAQDWIKARSFRAQQAGKVIPSPASQPEQAAAPQPERVECEAQMETLPGGFAPYVGSDTRDLMDPQDPIEVAPAILREQNLPTTTAEWIRNESERIRRGQARIEEALAEVVVGDPEGLAAANRRSERLTQELKEAYAEIAALRRATAGVGKHPGARFYESMGQALEMDADGLLDLLDQHEDLPAEVATFLKAMSRNLGQFALNCVAYAGTL